MLSSAQDDERLHVDIFIPEPDIREGDPTARLLRPSTQDPSHPPAAKPPHRSSIHCKKLCDRSLLISNVSGAGITRCTMSFRIK